MEDPAAATDTPTTGMALEDMNASTNGTTEKSGETKVETLQPAATTEATAEATSTSPQNVKEDVNKEEAETDRHWDCTNRKVLVTNLLKYVDAKLMRRMVTKWMSDLNGNDKTVDFKIKKPPKDNFMVVTLAEESMVQPFMDYINNNDEITNKRGGKLRAHPVDSKTDQAANANKRRGDDNNDSRDGIKRQKREARRPVTHEEIKDKVIPLWRLSKEEQEKTKMKEMIKKCSQKIVSELKQRFRTLSREKGRESVSAYPWLLGNRSIEMRDIVAAPTPLRNKCEFNFGYKYLFDQTTAADGEAADGEAAGTTDGEAAEAKEPPKVPAAGFMVTGWAGGVCSPVGCPNIPPEVCTLVDLINTFLETSPLPVYDSFSHSGFYRVLTIRTSRRTGECMVIIQHASPKTGGPGVKRESEDEVHPNAQHFESERKRLVDVLAKAELPVPGQTDPLKITSIFFQEFDGLSTPPPHHPVQHVYGKTCLTEQLGKCSFQISPGAFFQVNTEGAEMLYNLAVQKVKEVSKDPEKTLLFDVCCGTGTIGLTCMKEGVVGKVVGVDISEPAIADAKQNAELNGFGSEGNDDDKSKQKTRFVAAKAEYVMQKEISAAKKLGCKFVAVVDPAREGLHPDVVKALRANERIGRIVYVSCNPTATLTRDAVMLCSPPTKKYSGRPFKVESASPVDMFPLTKHCEVVMTFDRSSDADLGVKDDK